MKLESPERPTGKDVSSRLRFVALKSISQSIDEQFANMLSHCGNLEFGIERLTFTTWLWSLDQIGSVVEPITQIESVFQRALGILNKLQAELEKLKALQDALYPLFIQLRGLNEQLLLLLLKYLQKRIRTRVELEILEGKSSKAFNATEGALEASSTNSRILILSAIKHMTTMTSKYSDTSIKMEEGDVNVTKQLPTYSLGNIPKNDCSPEKSVLVEWMRYGPHSQDEMISKQLFDRMENILQLPQKTAELSGMYVCVRVADLSQPG